MSDDPRYDVEAVKAAVSVPDALERYGDLHKRHGNRCPCPIHGGKDNNLAFRDNSFHCFVCGAGGDVITLVEKIFNLSFPDAVRKLAEDFGIAPGVDPEAIRRRQLAAEARKRRAEREKDDFRRLATFYHQVQDLPSTPFRDNCVRTLAATIDEIIQRGDASSYPVDEIISTMRQGLQRERQLRTPVRFA
jgi:DNA primase